tara:strand:+ start:42889 stop:43446 length:558 start_codon:yes stop_codon:yes gene_type:complete
VSIKIYENFLDSQEIDVLVNFSKQPNNVWGSAEVEFWNQRFIHYKNIDNESVRKILITKRKEISELIRKDFEIKETLYSDLLQIVRWIPGYELDPHADSENPDGSEHPFSYREYASITYLNEDYSGGEIYFPEQNDFSPQIKPGTLVFFPGTLEFLHGVKEVTQGVRYTIASFFTRDRTRSDGEV